MTWRLSYFLFFIFVPGLLFAQMPNPSTWVNGFSGSGPAQYLRNKKTQEQFMAADSGLRTRYWAVLQATASGSHTVSAARALSVQPVLAGYTTKQLDCAAKDSIHDAALKLALQSNDDWLLAECLERAGDSYNDCRQNDKALLYLLKAHELRQQAGLDGMTNTKRALLNLGGVFFNAQEYDSCIVYTLKGLSEPGPFENKGKLMSALNIIAISAQRLQRFDSAARWFNKALQTAKDSNLVVWTGIIEGNIGYLHMQQGKYTEALPLMWNDYRVSLEAKDTSNAANTLQRIARIYAETARTDSALRLARLAFSLTSPSTKYINPTHRKNVLETLAFVLQLTGHYAEAFEVQTGFYHLKDSLQAVVAKSQFDRIQLRIQFDNSASLIKNLQAANEEEKKRRNLLLLSLLLVGICGLLLVLWTKQRHKTRQQALLQEKQLVEAAAAAAEEQLNQFTRFIVEKNEMIEQLHQQLTVQQQEVNDALLKQTILTDVDWRRFKEMFEKVYPGFFSQLLVFAPDITAAEMRMASVIRLGLGNKYIASMLGVSGDTVRKAKFRLRQRLQLTEDQPLEMFISAIG